MAIEIESKVFQKTSLAAQHPTTDVFIEPGYVLTGGGAFIQYQEPGNLLTHCHPIQAPDGSWVGWRAYGKDCWLISKATITAYAIGIKVTRKGQPVPAQQTVFMLPGNKAELPNPLGHDGWVAVGGGAKCVQNIYENVILSASYPLSNSQQAECPDAVTGWGGNIQYCCSPTSNRGPAGGGDIKTFLIAIRAEGIQFQTKIIRQKSQLASRPEIEAHAAGGVVVSGGANNNQVKLSFDQQSINMLTSTQPVFGSNPSQITGWKAVGKDHQHPSPSVIQASVVTLTATEAPN